MGGHPLRPVRRVMLIFPPMHDIRHVDTMVCPPIGIASLAAFIRDIVEVSLLDCIVEAPGRRVAVNDRMELVGLSYEDIIGRIRAQAPDMVGISCVFSSQFASVREISRRIKKEVDPDIVIVTGGTHPSFLPEETLSGTDVDYVVLGEGELTLRALIEAHNNGGEIGAIDGLAFRTDSGVHVNPRRKWVENLDDLPWPARDLLPMEDYFTTRVPMGLHWRRLRNTPIVSSRGCPYRCPFCSSYIHWGKRFRKRSPENVLAEIEHLRDRYNVQELKWQDDNLTADRQRAKEIFQGMIDRGLAMPWNTPNGIALWTLDEDMLRLMKKSGCYEITLAVESADPVSFKEYVGKPFTFEKVRQVAAMARRNGMATVAYFIIGFPGEPLHRIENSMQKALELGVDYLSPFIFNPLPGSDLWYRCLAEGYISENYTREGGNNYFQSDVGGKDFTTADLVKIQSRTYFRNLLCLPFRNPKEFVAWYGRQFLFNPGFLRTFAIHVFQTLKGWKH